MAFASDLTETALQMSATRFPFCFVIRAQRKLRPRIKMMSSQSCKILQVDIHSYQANYPESTGTLNEVHGRLKTEVV